MGKYYGNNSIKGVYMNNGVLDAMDREMEEYCCKCGAVIFNDAETCLACAIDNMKGEKG
jgi:hypothetical protein